MKAGIFLIACAALAPASQGHAQDATPGGLDMSGMMSMDMNDMSHMAMPGMYGTYTMTREASGTSWQPDATPMAGIHAMGDGAENPWTTMWHGTSISSTTTRAARAGTTRLFPPAWACSWANVHWPAAHSARA